MQLNIGQVTLIDYLGMIDRKEVVINRDYQRQSGLWPKSARSYFIDSLLEGYPIPKMYFFQSFNEKTRRPYKELVDGQQRTSTIQDFYNDKFPLTSASRNYSGLRFSDLDEVAQQNFLSYQIEHSTILAANRSELLEMFRRMNSYTAPLKEAEKRHSIYQGLFKWFIVEQADELSPLLTSYGILSDKVVSRMGDAEFIAELVAVMEHGFHNKSNAVLNNLYKNYDSQFDEEVFFERMLKKFFDEIANNLQCFYGTPLFRSYVVHSLFCAYAAIWFGFHGSEAVYAENPSENKRINYDLAIPALRQLSEAQEEQDDEGEFADYVEACNFSTTKRPQRVTRTRYLVKALLGEL